MFIIKLIIVMIIVLLKLIDLGKNNCFVDLINIISVIVFNVIVLVKLFNVFILLVLNVKVLLLWCLCEYQYINIDIVNVVEWVNMCQLLVSKVIELNQVFVIIFMIMVIVVSKNIRFIFFLVVWVFI